MKSLVFTLGIIVYTSICLAQVTLNVTSYALITSNASYDIVNIAENAVLELSGTAIVDVYNYTVQSDAAGKIYMGNNSTIVVHQNAELHVNNSVNGMLGEIVACATAATIRNITIENSGFINTEAIRNDNQYNVNLNNSTNGAGIAEIGTFKVSNGSSDAFLNINSIVKVTVGIPSISDDTGHWSYRVNSGGEFCLNDGITFYSTHDPMDVYPGGTFRIDGAHFVFPAPINVMGTFICENNATIGQGAYDCDSINVGLDFVTPVSGTANFSDSEVDCMLNVASLGVCNIESSSIGANAPQNLTINGILNIADTEIVSNLELSNGGIINATSGSVLDIIGSLSGHVELTQSILKTNGTLYLNNNSLVSLNGSSLIDVCYTSPGIYGCLYLNSGSVIECSPASQTLLGDQIIVRYGAWIGSDITPGISPIVRRHVNTTDDWPGIIIYTSFNVPQFGFDNCDFSGMDYFSIKGDGNACQPIIFRGCSFHNMKGLFVNKYVECRAEPQGTNPTSFSHMKYGVVVEDYATYISDGCFYDAISNGAITGYKSRLNVGGYWTQQNGYISLNPNTFTHVGGFSVVSAFFPPTTGQRSVIYGNTVGTGNLCSGLNLEETVAYIELNNVEQNEGHGFIGKSNYLYGVISNNFVNNGGAEYYSDVPNMASLHNGQNYFQDDVINPNGSHLPPPPFNYGSGSYADCDGYFLIKSNMPPLGTPTDVTGNHFNGVYSPIPSDQPRFYPSFNSYVTGRDVNQLFLDAVQLFESELYEEATALFKQVLIQYPESSEAICSLNYLFYSTYNANSDYSSLRLYLTTISLPDSSQVKTAAENCITRCLIAEDDYAAAIPRLEIVLQNPSNALDSLYAAINQGYCYYKLSEEGRGTPQNCTIKTTTIEELQLFISSLNIETPINSLSVPPTNAIYLSNYPNPFNPETRIFYGLPYKGSVEVCIYNLRGQLVKRLVNADQDAATHSTVWNGKNDEGQVVGSGVYFCRVKFGSTQSSRKIMLMK